MSNSGRPADSSNDEDEAPTASCSTTDTSHSGTPCFGGSKRRRRRQGGRKRTAPVPPDAPTVPATAATPTVPATAATPTVPTVPTPLTVPAEATAAPLTMPTVPAPAAATSTKKPLFIYRCHVKEDHGKPLYGIQFNCLLSEGQPDIFATVGSNRVSIYECPKERCPPGIRLLQVFEDSDPNENFYTCAWSYYSDAKKPILAAAGAKGVIRLFCPATWSCIRHYIGHGNSINELKFNPQDPNILLSASKDYALRLWNTTTDVCIAIMGGVDGHRAEILTADFNILGTCIMSGGMDHSLKMWRLDKEDVKAAIAASYTHETNSNNPQSFNTLMVHFTDYTIREIHGKYIDSLQWFGEMVFSKACTENRIVCWKPGPPRTGLADTNSGAEMIKTFRFEESDLFFMKFSMEFTRKLLAVGNQVGQLYVWDLNTADPTETTQYILEHPSSQVPIRQTSFSRNGCVLLAAADDGTIWRWDKQ